MVKKLIISIGLLAILFGCAHLPAIPKSEAYIRERSVKLIGRRGTCSGEQVKGHSGIDYILSAGHCKVLADSDNTILIQTEDKHVMRRRIIAEDPNSDLLLIEGLPDLEGLEIAERIVIQDHVRTFTHGAGMDTYMTEGEVVQQKHIDIGLFLISSEEDLDKCRDPKHRIEQVVDIMGENKAICLMSVWETVVTAKIVPGSSGGMIVNDAGQLIGVASATDGSFGYIVNLEHIQDFLSNY